MTAFRTLSTLSVLLLALVYHSAPVEGFAPSRAAASWQVTTTSSTTTSQHMAPRFDKDTQRLPALYWNAGIDEYWLVDARHQELVFRIQLRGDSGFFDVEAHDGWIDSAVFRRSFKLTRIIDSLGHPEFTLSVRPTS